MSREDSAPAFLQNSYSAIVCRSGWKLALKESAINLISGKETDGFFLIEKWFLLDRLQKCADLKSQLQGNTLDMQEDYWILRLFSGI